MALNLLGSEKKLPERPQPSMPRLTLPADDDAAIEQEAREAALRVSQQKIIRAGRDAWQFAQKAATFEHWTTIGKALKIGRDVAMRASGVGTGKHYAKAFYAWADRYGFDGMHKSERWAAVDLAENIEAVEQWRETLPEKERKRLIHPLSNVRRWRRATSNRASIDAAKSAAVWRRFVSALAALSPEQREQAKVLVCR